MDPAEYARAGKRPRKGPIFQMEEQESSNETQSSDSDEFLGRYQADTWLKALDACYAPEVQVRICREHARYVAAMLKSKGELKSSRKDSQMDCSSE